ncbi:MAG: lysophospholipid acyltransferase family protein [Bdellovibrionales bacterium]
MKAFLKRRVLPGLVYWFYRLWTASWRVRLVEPAGMRNAEGPLIFAHWHGDELAITHLVPTYRIATMTSTSSDGSLIDHVIQRLGGATSRGSSTRGGVSALKGLIRLLRQNFNASMAVDGPKGPLHKVKPGVFELSRLAKARVVPVGVASSSAFIFQKSWNKAKLPKPFARVVVTFGTPWPALTAEDDIRAQVLAQRLERALSDAHHQAAKLIAD